MFQTTCNETFDWLSSLTARVGYAWGRALYYAKGGVAWGQENVSLTCNLGPRHESRRSKLHQPSRGAGQFRLGQRLPGRWNSRYGAEFGLTRNWSAKAEWDWIGFGTKSLVLSDGTPITSKLNVFEGKVGVNIVGIHSQGDRGDPSGKSFRVLVPFY